jgi:hypothetical protein
MKSRYVTIVLPLFLLGWCVTGHGAEKQIKVFRVGSSSFSYMLIQDTRAIVEASGYYKLVCDEKGDQAGYTRLDQFLTQPGLFEEWCREQIPRINAGGYDFVIIQTIGWLNFKPEQQERLCTEIIPELAMKIQKTGAEVILYDKYLPIQFEQKDPRARTWCLRYPEGYELNYRLHILAAKHAGISKISFGGQAVTRVWQEDHFAQLRFLYCDPGHPGPMANYISAVNLAYLLTGEDPVGSPVRALPFEGGRALAFSRLAGSDRSGDRELYEANKDRIGDGKLMLSDEEALRLQTVAMNSQRQWGALLKANLESDEKLTKTLEEIARIQAEMDKFEEHGLDAGTVAALKAKFAPPASPGELKPELIAKIRRKSRSIEYADTDVRNYYRRFLTRERQRPVQEQYARYWQENNSKLRDDVYFQCRVLEEKALRDGRREEARDLSAAAGMIRNLFKLSAYRILLEHVNPEQQQEILTEYQVTGPTKRNSPAFAAYQNEHHRDREKLLPAWEVYLDIWSDPDRMDRLRDNGYPLEVFLEADREFAARMGEGR